MKCKSVTYDITSQLNLTRSRWDLKASQYRLVESSKSDFEDSELNQYVFIVRV